MVVTRRRPESIGPKGLSVDDAKEGGTNKDASSSSTLLPQSHSPREGVRFGASGNRCCQPSHGNVSITVLIATSSNRSGFGPQLLISYDSVAGNWDFGMVGIYLCLPSFAKLIRDCSSTTTSKTPMSSSSLAAKIWYRSLAQVAVVSRIRPRH
jgi:hypothetical protein